MCQDNTEVKYTEYKKVTSSLLARLHLLISHPALRTTGSQLDTRQHKTNMFYNLLWSRINLAVMAYLWSLTEKDYLHFYSPSSGFSAVFRSLRPPEMKMWFMRALHTDGGRRSVVSRNCIHKLAGHSSHPNMRHWNTQQQNKSAT